jgi:hypothetical protein
MNSAPVDKEKASNTIADLRAMLQG